MKEREHITVKQKWNEIFADALAAKRNWQMVAFGELVIIFTLAIGLIVIAAKAEIRPYVVEVDNLGRAMAVAPAVAADLRDDKIIRAHLYHFIELSRAVIADPHAMRKNLHEVYNLVLPSVKENVLDVYYKINNPLEMGMRLSRQVVPLSFLRQSNNSFIVEWKEITRDMSHKLIGEGQWKALITIERIRDQYEKQVELNPANPFGIYIKNISWNKTL